MPTKKWTEGEEEFLKVNYMTMSNADLAEKFNTTKNAVQKKLARMGLKRSEAAEEPVSEDESDAETIKEEKPPVISMESHFYIGNKLFYEERNYKKAIEEYQKAAKEESDETIRLKALYWLAESYVKIHNIEEAVKILSNLADENEKHYIGDSAKRRLAALKTYIFPTT